MRQLTRMKSQLLNLSLSLRNLPFLQLSLNQLNIFKKSVSIFIFQIIENCFLHLKGLSFIFIWVQFQIRSYFGSFIFDFWKLVLLRAIFWPKVIFEKSIFKNPCLRSFPRYLRTVFCILKNCILSFYGQTFKFVAILEVFFSICWKLVLSRAIFFAKKHLWKVDLKKSAFVFFFKIIEKYFGLTEYRLQRT